MDPWEGGSGSRAGEAVGGTPPSPLCWPSSRQRAETSSWARVGSALYSHRGTPGAATQGRGGGILYFLP